MRNACLTRRRKLALVVMLGLVGCTPAVMAVPETPNPIMQPSTAATKPVTRVTELSPVDSAVPMATALSPSPMASDTIAATPTQATECGEGYCIYPGHFVLQRPIQNAPWGTIDPTYRYATTNSGKREPHRGVEFQAPFGESVLAAAEGTVIAILQDGEDADPTLGIGYGNAVILEHPNAGKGAPLYTLYAHLSEIDVALEQTVKVGSVLGKVGDSGAATGPHLHFEVRVGAESVDDTQNPELWLLPGAEEPGKGKGVLAGRVEQADGSLARVKSIAIQVLEPNGSPGRTVAYTETYAKDEFQGDGVWRENFAVGDLVAGEYRVAFMYEGELYAQKIEVQAGKLSLLKVVVSNS